MPKLPRLTARQIITVLERAGFTLARQSGSHMIYKNAAGKRVTALSWQPGSASQSPQEHPARR